MKHVSVSFKTIDFCRPRANKHFTVQCYLDKPITASFEFLTNPIFKSEEITSTRLYKSRACLRCATLNQPGGYESRLCLQASFRQKDNYNKACALALSNTYWPSWTKSLCTHGRAYRRWRVQFQYSYKISVEFSASFFCLSFGNVKNILNNPNSTSSFWLLLS